MIMIITFLLKDIKFQHSNTIKYRKCIWLLSSQLRYSIKFLVILNHKSESYLVIWEFECLELQYPSISIFGSSFLKIYFLYIYIYIYIYISELAN